MLRMSGLRYVPADMCTHWEGLQDLPEAALEAAVTRAIRTRVDFPVPRELREDADASAYGGADTAQDDRSEAIEPLGIPVPQAGVVLPVTRLWRYFCEECSDMGWRSWWCGAAGPTRKPWHEDRDCGRRRPHEPHEWVENCPCVETNPDIVRRKAREKKFTEQGGKGQSVRVSPQVILAPETLTTAQIQAETNAEVRRVMIERMGWDRWLAETGATPVQSDRFGSLYRTEMDGARLGVVVVTNSTPETDGHFKRYALLVPAEHETAHAAVASTFGLTAAQYQPALET